MSDVKKFLHKKKKKKRSIPMSTFIDTRKRCLDSKESEETQEGSGEGVAMSKTAGYPKRTHKFAQAFKKSIDYKNTTTSVDTMDQHNAETTTESELVKYIKENAGDDISKISFPKGKLTLSKKEAGVYNGFFSDTDGQVVEKFDGQTIEMIAKHMELKELYEKKEVVKDQAVESAAHEDEEQDKELIQEEAGKQIEEALEEHNSKYHQGQEPGEPITSVKQGNGKKGLFLRIKAGDFEIELRKSVRDFVHNFKKAKEYGLVDQDLIQKALTSWRKKNQGVMNIPNNTVAARVLLENWDSYHEEFNQTVYALEQVSSDNE